MSVKRNWWSIVLWSFVVGLVPLFVLVNATVIRPLVEQSKGNYRIDYYGRVTDDQGSGVAGVEIEFCITYSGGPVRPGMFGRSENFRFVKVTSEKSGNFAIKRQYGYSVRIHSVWHAGRRVALRAVGLTKEDAPGYGVLMDDPWSRKKLPNSPNKRVVCKVVPLSSELSPALKGRP